MIYIVGQVCVELGSTIVCIYVICIREPASSLFEPRDKSFCYIKQNILELELDRSDHSSDLQKTQMWLIAAWRHHAGPGGSLKGLEVALHVAGIQSPNGRMSCRLNVENGLCGEIRWDELDAASLQIYIEPFTLIWDQFYGFSRNGLDQDTASWSVWTKFSFLISPPVPQSPQRHQCQCCHTWLKGVIVTQSH